MIIRNDDVSCDTDVNELATFCGICDKYGFKVMHCLTPLGRTHKIHVDMTNDEIAAIGGKCTLWDNKELIDFLWQRDNDIFAVHGLWHSHVPSLQDIKLAKALLKEFEPEYFVPPFNEGNYPHTIAGLVVSAKTERIEDMHDTGVPSGEIAYLHSWRYDNNWYTWGILDQCLKRIAAELNADTLR